MSQSQWKVVNKHKICDSCLLPGHHWKNCPTHRQQRCPDCQNSHHPNLGCIPKTRQSPYPSTQGNTLFTHSFSRTCPVILNYPKSGRSVEGLAIIDDQSMVSFVRPSIPKELNIARADLTSDVLITSTVNGIHKSDTNLIKNLHVRPLTGGASTPRTRIRCNCRYGINLTKFFTPLYMSNSSSQLLMLDRYSRSSATEEVVRFAVSFHHFWITALDARLIH